jgi:hypothetical protein
MTIVRELTTKLGFQFDQSNLNKFESSIIGFKTKFGIAAAAIAGTLKTLTDGAIKFSDNIISTDALAKFSKVPVEILDAWQSVFRRFDIPQETFSKVFEQLSLNIKKASKREPSPFLDLIYKSNQAVRLTVDGITTNTKQAFEDIREYVRKFSDESEQLRIIQNVFGVDNTTASNILNLFNKTNEEFDLLVENEKKSAEEIKKNTENARAFKEEINQLGVEWGKLSDRISRNTVGPLTSFFKKFNDFSVDINNKGLKTAIQDNIKYFDNQSLKIIPKFESVFGSDAKRKSYFEEQDLNNKGFPLKDATIINNNTFEFNVPEGTPEEQAKFQTEQIIRAIDFLFEQKTREVFNNNPQIEV